MKIQIPKKTFLVGEYAVLAGGQALVLATEPGFEVEIDSHVQVSHQFHQESAAGLFLKDQKTSQIKISDINSIGGFGRSTAEFIAAWVSFYGNQTVNLKKIYDEYLNLYTQDHRRQQPSGADLMGMICGNITHFNSQISEIKVNPWPFKDIDFAILSTGFKVKTHEHLSHLNRDHLIDLVQPSYDTIQSFYSENSKLFIQSLKSWSELLHQKKLQHNDSWLLKLQFESMDHVLMAKPNGALGADTLTLIYLTEHKKTVFESVKNMNFSVLATSKNLHQGLRYVG